MKKIPQDIVGNIAILKFPKSKFYITKKLSAIRFLKNHPHITTIVEKTEKISGKLRTPTTKYLAGEKTYIANYKENNSIFRFNINKSYFSPRLSNERKIIAEQVVKLTEKIKKPKNTNHVRRNSPIPNHNRKSSKKKPTKLSPSTQTN